jgi:DNA-binding CsgD family transcriptional regulator
VTLREVLTSIDVERRRVAQQVHMNVERVILPQLRSLNDGLNRQQQRAIEQIVQGLEEIASPFVGKVSRAVASLSATELRVRALVKRGLGVKEIVELEHLSPETVAAHRRSIHRKLGIAHTKTNLRTYLQTAFHATDAAVKPARFQEGPRDVRGQAA